MNKIKNYKSKRPTKYIVSYYGQSQKSWVVGCIDWNVSAKLREMDLLKIENFVKQEFSKKRGFALESVVVLSITKL